MENNSFSRNILEFCIFCVESLGEHLNKTGDVVYRALTEKSDILSSYIIPCYDVLHTQGKKYIISDIMEILQERGVVV